MSAHRISQNAAASVYTLLEVAVYRRPQRNRQLFESSYFRLCSTEIRNVEDFNPEEEELAVPQSHRSRAHMNVAPAQEAAAAKNMVLTSPFGVKSGLSDSWMTPHEQHVFCGARGHRRDHPLGGIILLVVVYLYPGCEVKVKLAK